ncbi:MAG: glycosyltransferase [Chitinophagaceae bacterium]|nr:glycosyltransferase [Chitinophagaceae bacterium]
MKILWLASWYPNKIIPLEGDFVQRHARAVSAFTPVTVIYVAQYGEGVPIKENKIEKVKTGNLTEIIIYFRFPTTGFPLLNKIIYNWKYYAVYKKYIREYFSANGKPDVVHVHVPMKAGVIAQWIKRKWSIPYIVSEHSATYVVGAFDAFDKRSFYFRRAVSSVFKNAAIVTSVSGHDGNILKQKFNLDRVDVIHNVADTNYFFLKPGVPKKFRFIHISVMNYQKNVEGILNACALLKDLQSNWEIEFIGRGLSPEISKIIDDLQLRNFIIVTGEINNAEVAQHMQNASALVLFSRYENFPCVIVEALCCGIPVIATNVGGIPEAVNDLNGKLVTSEHEEELAYAMHEMLTQYYKYNREKIASNAKDKYAYQEIGKQFFELYKELN